MNMVIISVLAISCIPILAGAVFVKYKNFVAKIAGEMLSFSAGVMICAALLELMPESAEGIGYRTTGFICLIGIALFFCIEKLVAFSHSHTHEDRLKAPAAFVIVGDTIHNFIDGVAIAAAFSVSPAIGFATAIAVAAHEIPQEIADITILINSGMKPIKAIFINASSGFSALLGAIAGVYFIQKIEQFSLYFIAASAGMFIYIACSDLIPSIEHKMEGKKKVLSILYFLAGILLMVAAVRFELTTSAM